MPSNIILECSERNGQTISNSEWVSSFSEPVSIDDGDIIQLSQAILNTQTVSSGGIVIDTDTELTIQVAYYENALCKIEGTQTEPLPFGSKDFKGIKDGNDDNVKQKTVYESSFNNNVKPCGFYICRQGVESDARLLTHEVKILIKARTYDPNSLASLITTKVEESVDFTIIGGGGLGGVMIDLSFDLSYHMVQVPGKQHTFEGENPDVDSYQNDAFVVNGGSTYFQQEILRYIGASSFSLEFVNGKFSFTNLHSPVFGDSAEGTFSIPSIGLIATG